MSNWTPKAKAGCAIGIIGFFVRLPLMYAGTILLYQHVDAPTIVWVLLWIGVPIAVLLEIAQVIFKSAFEE